MSNNSDSEKASGNSLEEETSSFGSLDAFISNVGGGINQTEVHMPLRVLIEGEIQDNLQRRERVKDYI